jgi:hypothetical protein
MLKRIWVSMGWLGAAQCVVPIITIAVFAIHGTFGSAALWSRSVVVIVSAFAFSLAMRGYKNTQKTSPCAAVLPPLVSSPEEFCLILRPFGSDGGIIINAPKTFRDGRERGSVAVFRRTLTMEQIIAQAGERTLGQKTYAMVDQDKLLAPPGPVYMRAPHRDWQDAVGALIRRSYAIFLVLPANQELRDSFNWEIEQIIANELQSRTVIILPPHDPDPAGFATCIRHAAVLAATMESIAGTVAAADPSAVRRYETQLAAEKPLMIKFAQSDRDSNSSLLRLVAVDPPGKKRRAVLRKVKLEVTASTYASALGKALAEIHRELAGTSFSARYPVHSASRARRS